MTIKILEYENLPIEEQLKIEEDLLRNKNDNYCLINSGSSEKTIVMGLSSKKNEMVHLEKVERDQVKVIQRFSGGGTVIVDENTIFVTFIFNHDAHDFDPYPQPILKWSGEFYQSALNIDGFSLKENDYAIGELKIGGNAQYLKRNRWLHHTSFLYDFDVENMEYLAHPKKQPEYRLDRPHHEFITSLKPHISKNIFIERVKSELSKRYELSHFQQI